MALLNDEKYQYGGEDMVICPFCDNEFENDQLHVEKVQTGLKEFHYIYSCPKCENEL